MKKIAVHITSNKKELKNDKAKESDKRKNEAIAAIDFAEPKYEGTDPMVAESFRLQPSTIRPKRMLHIGPRFLPTLSPKNWTAWQRWRRRTSKRPATLRWKSAATRRPSQQSLGRAKSRKRAKQAPRANQSLLTSQRKFRKRVQATLPVRVTN